MYASYLSLCFKRKTEESLQKAAYFLLVLAVVAVVLSIFSSGYFIQLPFINGVTRSALFLSGVVLSLVSTGFAILLIMLMPSISAASCRALRYAWPRAYHKVALRIDPNGMTWVGRMCKYYFTRNEKISRPGTIDDMGVGYLTNGGNNAFVTYDGIKFIMFGKDIIVVQPHWAESMCDDIVFHANSIAPDIKQQVEKFIETVENNKKPLLL